MTETADRQSATSPFITGPGEGQAFWYLDALAQIKAPAAATGGQVSVGEHTLPHRSSPPLHVHAREDEAWYVLEGTITYQVGNETLVAEAGSFVWAPRGIPHSFRTDSPTARLLTICVPGGFEDFFAAIGRPAATLTLPPAPEGPPDMQVILGHSQAYGCEIVGPPMS